jgi:2-polyprenyl-6-methoxyphenol hydroxylase-like FAD-dependent oxidoreductase
VVGGRIGMAIGVVRFRTPPQALGLTPAQDYLMWGLTDVDETFAIRIRTSPAVPAWPPSRVTVLGDAIHAMSPARGSGANTALQGAALLGQVLTTDGSDVVAAIGEYERRMREYGYAAVAASRQAEAQTGARRNRLLFWLYRRLARS